MNLVGDYNLHIGASLERAFKARRAAEARTPFTKPSKYTEFYAFRYNFKPESIDASRPGIIQPGEPSNGSETFVVEQPSSQSDDLHVFTAVQQPGKQEECVLIFDENTGLVTIERLEVSLNLRHDGRAGRTRSSGSPAPRPYSLSMPPTPPDPSFPQPPKITVNGSPQGADDDLAQLEVDLINLLDAETDEDADGEFEAAADAMRQEEEEEEEEFPPLLEEPPPRPKAAPLPFPTKYTPPAPLAQHTPDEEIMDFGVPSRPVTRTAPSHKGKSKKADQSVPLVPSIPPRPGPSKKRDLQEIDSDVEEEILQFGQPSRPTKRARPSTQPPIPPVPDIPPIPTILNHQRTTSLQDLLPKSSPNNTHPSLMSPSGSNSESDSSGSDSESGSSDSEDTEDEPMAAVPVHAHPIAVAQPLEEEEEELGDDFDQNLFAEIDQELGEQVAADSASDSDYDER